MKKNIKCTHNIFKNECKKCRYKCKHGKQISRCSKCGGASLCIHLRERYYCRLCKGKGICEHLKIKRVCLRCKIEKKNLFEEKINYFLNDKLLMSLIEFYILELKC